jgi:nicotinate-nucleotide pyrophosphorylase (carboxylating)
VNEQATEELVRRALDEDLAGYGDITSRWTVPLGLAGTAFITAREDMVVCGLPLAEAVMREIDSDAVFTGLVRDGEAVGHGARLATVDGVVRSILTAERTMLNFISHLSGVATQSRRFAQAVEGTTAAVVDTRKTTPGLRFWEKRAVAYGGCGNHRFGLFDMVLIKDNHLAAAGGVREAVNRVKKAHPHYVKIEVEVENEADLREAVACGVDVIMLDNQRLTSLRSLVAVARELDPRILLEASGGVTLESLEAIAECGVDLISTSALTMGAPAMDVGLTLTLGE